MEEAMEAGITAGTHSPPAPSTTPEEHGEGTRRNTVRVRLVTKMKIPAAGSRNARIATTLTRTSITMIVKITTQIPTASPKSRTWVITGRITDEGVQRIDTREIP
jgi:hypothetical protein